MIRWPVRRSDVRVCCRYRGEPYNKNRGALPTPSNRYRACSSVQASIHIKGAFQLMVISLADQASL